MIHLPVCRAKLCNCCEMHEEGTLALSSPSKYVVFIIDTVDDNIRDTSSLTQAFLPALTHCRLYDILQKTGKDTFWPNFPAKLQAKQLKSLCICAVMEGFNRTSSWYVARSSKSSNVNGRISNFDPPYNTLFHKSFCQYSSGEDLIYEYTCIYEIVCLKCPYL